MPLTKAQIKNNGVSNVVSRKMRAVNIGGRIAIISRRVITEFSLGQKHQRYRSLQKDAPDLVCLSHLRWNFVSKDLNIL